MTKNLALIPDLLRSLAYTSITSSYVAVGTALTVNPRIVRFVNTTSVDLLISWDGVNDNEILPANGFLILDVTANSSGTTEGYELIKIGTIFYTKTAGSPASGAVYISNYHTGS